MRSFWQEMRGGFAALRPEHFPYARFIAALILGFIGGAIFNALTLPLPWMLGPMTFCTIAAILRAPIAAPTVVRPPMSAVIGVMLGAAFTPAILTNLLDWVPTIIGLAFFVAVSGSACVLYFRKIGGMDMTDGPFCRPMPGRAGSRNGWCGRATSVRNGRNHSRWCIRSRHSAGLEMTLPFLVELVRGRVSWRQRPIMRPSVTGAPLHRELWIYRLRCLLAPFRPYPASACQIICLGPMLVSAFVQCRGINRLQAPAWIVQVRADSLLVVTIRLPLSGSPAAR